VEVTDVLRDRMQQPDGLQFPATVSLLVHVAIAAALIFGPPIHWLSRTVEDEQKPVMSISLGGAGTGPSAGGLTSIGARPVQTTEPAPAREALRAPAAATPEMTTPLAKTPPPKAAKAPPKPVEPVDPLPDARGKTLARGDELRTGSAVAETGARGQGFGGLSTGGGAGTETTLDVANFCCPDYLVLMRDKIQNNWNQRAEVRGAVVVKFTIQRDGRLTDYSVEQTSGYTALDNNALRAVVVTRQLTPLPSDFPNPTLTVHTTFKN
jgi:TonB family protein